ncbi:uncharacterized protein METZ01_LOCUS314440, partial [marine metagenome]
VVLLFLCSSHLGYPSQQAGMGFMTGSWGTYLVVLTGCLVFSGAISLGIRFAALGKPKLSARDRDRPSTTK